MCVYMVGACCRVLSRAHCIAPLQGASGSGTRNPRRTARHGMWCRDEFHLCVVVRAYPFCHWGMCAQGDVSVSLHTCDRNVVSPSARQPPKSPPRASLPANTHTIAPTRPRQPPPLPPHHTSSTSTALLPTPKLSFPPVMFRPSISNELSRALRNAVTLRPWRHRGGGTGGGCCGGMTVTIGWI